jgi:hypothetical protein
MAKYPAGGKTFSLLGFSLEVDDYSVPPASDAQNLGILTDIVSDRDCVESCKIHTREIAES